jgi:hypothetical protein
MLWQDPIVAQVRRIREEYAARFNHDIKAICRAARENEKAGGREVVVLPPKPAAGGRKTKSPTAV